MSNSLINKRIVAVIAAAASVFSLTACGSGTSKNDTEASKDVQVVNIAGVTGKKPYTFVDGNNYTGYDFELLKKIDEKTVVPEKLRTLDRGRPWRDSQFASTRLSPSRDMSR
ncbi:MAG: hypothetical protein ACLT3W_00050 [Bifidobacterium pseudocatenulatum]